MLALAHCLGNPSAHGFACSAMRLRLLALALIDLEDGSGPSGRAAKAAAFGSI